MWISNTATMLMMLPICLSVVSLLADDFGKESPKAAKNFAICMLLGIAFATSVGGVGTLIGTPPNAFFKGYMSNNYGIEIDFFRWMLIGIPVVIIMVSVLWLTMVKWIFRVDIDNNEKIDAVIQKELSQLGPMTKDEKVVTAIFAFTALFWMMRGILKPWLPDGLNDIIIAIIGALALFVIPVDFKKFRFVITWKDAEKLPWGVLILFGGGLSLASGFQASGLAEWIGMQFAGFADYPTPLLILMITFIALVFTSMMSNVATTTVMLPILVPFAIAIGEHPFLFAIPATIVASCAFMLPVSTANNAIAFSTGHVHIGDMIKAGVFASMFSLVLLLLLAMALIPAIFDISMGTVPDWAIER
jgi:sodium-dependent dicarboxylate transporter 2/3/5